MCVFVRMGGDLFWYYTVVVVVVGWLKDEL